jgi:hypothetical protein
MRSWHGRLDRVPLVLAVIGGASLIELLSETRFGLAVWTTGSPLAYRGVLIELPGALWFLGVLLLELAAASDRSNAERCRRLNFYAFVWTIVGVAAAVWAFRHADSATRANWQYWVAFFCVCATFVAAACRELAALREIVRSMPADARFLMSRRTSWLVILACSSLIAFGPTASDVPSRRVPPLRGQALLDWFDSQPRKPLPPEYVKTQVVVARFIDYQCPACAADERTMKPVIEELRARFGNRLSFVTLDFPLERECNDGDEVPDRLHPIACEAAAAVGIVRERIGKIEPLTEWFWANQKGLTRADVFRMAKNQIGAGDPEALYPAALDRVRREASIAYQLGVRGTPSYWINGVVTPRRTPDDMKQLILHEMQRVAPQAVARTDNAASVPQGGGR